MKTMHWIVLFVVVIALGGGGLLVAQNGAVQAQDDGPGNVVFASDRTGNYEIFVLNPETGLTVQLTNNPAADIEPVWSPDGTAIAFASDRDGDFEIYVMQADGSDVRQLTNNMQQDHQPRWQPGGDHLVYVSDVNGQFDIYAISADGSMVRQLTNDTFDERGPGADTTPLPSESLPPTAVPATPTPSLPDAVVESYSLNVRGNPGEGAEIVTIVRRNDPLDIVGRRFDNSWLQVITPSGIRGWVYAPLVDLNIDLATIPIVDAPFIAPPPTATPTVAPPTASPVQISFTADFMTILPGGCATLSWNVSGIKAVYFQGEGVVGSGSRQVCPTTTTTYQLRVILPGDVIDDRYITVTVASP